MQTKTRWPWWWAVLALFAVQFLSGMIVAPQRSLFPVYAQERLAFSVFAISLLASLRQALGMIGAPLGGAWCDILGRRWTFLLGLTELAASTLVFLMRWPPLAVLLWAYSGFAAGLHTVGSQGYLIDAAQPALLGLLSALYNLSMTLGGALGNALSGPLVDRQGFGSFAAIMLLASLLTVLIALAGLPRVGSPAAARRANWRGGWFGYGDLILRPQVALLTLLRFLPTCYYGLATVFIPLWIYNLTKSATFVAWYGTVSLVVASLAQWAAGYLADRIGRRAPTLCATAALAASSAALGISGSRLWSVYLFGTLGASAAWSLSVLMTCLVSDVTGSEERGRVLGWLHLVWNAGMLAGSLLGGALFAVSVGLPFQVTAALNGVTVLAALCFFRLIDETNAHRRDAENAEKKI